MGGTSLGTKWRDIGVPIAVCLGLTPNWSLVLSAFFMFGALTTYWKSKGEDAKWFNWFLTGFFYVMAFAPYFHSVFKLKELVYAAVVNGILCSIWSETNDRDYLEEFGRGFLTCLTILLFLHK
jgi:hypothetical protein